MMLNHDVLDPDQVIPCNIIININDWVLVLSQGERFCGEVTNITGSDFEVNPMHTSGNLWKYPQKEDKIFCKWQNIIQQMNPPAVAGT